MTNLQLLNKAATLASMYLKLDFTTFVEKYGERFIDTPHYLAHDYTEYGYWGSFEFRIAESMSMVAEDDRRSDSEYEDAVRYAMGGLYRK